MSRLVPFPDGTVKEYPNGSMLWPVFPKKIIIEPVYGCDKRCGFCSLAGISEEKRLFMDETFFETRILAPLKQEELSVINLSGIGEPTLHPSYLYFVRRFKETFPKASIKTYTNGYMFKKRGDLSFLKEMTDAGVSLLLIDCYDKETETLVEAEKDKFGIVNCYDENVFSNSTKAVIAYNPIRQASFAETTAIRRPDTQGGLLPFKSWKGFGIDGAIFPVMKRCNKATKSMHIMYDGHVNMCCADNSRSFWMGDLATQTPREIWQSRDFDMVRYAMYRGWRHLIPTCYTCDRRSFRVGLYPHYGEKYSSAEIKEMARMRFKPTEDLMRNMKALDAAFPIKNEILREFLDE